jgi:hypothetical protein
MSPAAIKSRKHQNKPKRKLRSIAQVNGWESKNSLRHLVKVNKDSDSPLDLVSGFCLVEKLNGKDFYTAGTLNQSDAGTTLELEQNQLIEQADDLVFKIHHRDPFVEQIEAKVIEKAATKNNRIKYTLVLS